MAEIPPQSPQRRIRRSWWTGKFIVLSVLTLTAVSVSAYFIAGNGDSKVTHTTFPVKRGPLEIKVLEGGNIEALESQEVKSQVKGWQGTKILYIIEEGTYVTEEDVKNQLKLVELDSSELREKLTTAEIEFKGTQASLTEAQKGYEIQINKSETDIYAAELEVKFARMELEKFLGANVTGELLGEIDKLDALRIAADDTIVDDPTSSEDPIATSLLMAEVEAGDDAPQPLPEGVVQDEAGRFNVTLSALKLSHPAIDFTQYARSELLGDGEANQKIREHEDKLIVARKELGLANTRLEGQRRLFEREFITRNELENSEMEVEKQQISVESAEVAKSLFINYEFPKNAEKLMSDYIQAKRKLERTEQQALSELAQAEQKLLSAESRYRIEEERIREYQDQIDKCVMHAERAGLVVYGGSGGMYWNDEPIKEGATVRERQAIITIPDMTKMAAKVKIHESEIKKITRGQRARIRVDAYADTPLSGEVVKVAVLPDASNRWMNPDLKVYETDISIDGVHEWLKPGMSAKVEVLIDKLDDVLYVPIQSVVPDGKDQVCFVLKNGAVEKRVVELGPITIEYAVITSGVEEGEEVLIRPPAGSRNDETDEDQPWIGGESPPESLATPAEVVIVDVP